MKNEGQGYWVGTKAKFLITKLNTLRNYWLS